MDSLSEQNTEMFETTLLVPWAEIESNLGSLESVNGGYGDARRGLMTLENGNKIFVKIGASEPSRNAASKEIKAYAFLADNSYQYAPKLLSTNADKNGFALQAFLPEDGWDWSDTWNKERLDGTLVAMDALAQMSPDSRYMDLLQPVVTDDYNGWVKLMASEESRGKLIKKLEQVGAAAVLGDVQTQAETSSSFTVRHDTLVHDDVRADNCAWNSATREVKLVDWNWLELGDRRIDVSAMLAHVHESGFDILPGYADRLDVDALHWLAGVWLESAAQPIWPGGQEKLRDMQLQTGITALKLYNGLIGKT